MRATVVAALAALSTFAWTSTLSGQPGPTIGPEAYLDQEGYWPPTSLPIPVCWNAPEQRHEPQRQLVRTAVRTHIENQSGMRFTADWPACSDDALGIRISVSSNEWPVSQVGRQYARDANGERVREFGLFGDYKLRPTLMTLNFQLDQFAGFEGCRGQNDRCVQAVAVHEFMHAIGFLHEHLRKEAAQQQPNCPSAVSPPADFAGYKPLPVGAYDQVSVMNYCNNIYTGQLQLSPGDLAALRLWYPAN